MDGNGGAERFETVIIGGGQAGLSTGYHLRKRGMPFVILDSNERVGDAWRKRWDSLRLFTPRRFDGLHGMPFPGRGHWMPTKDQMAEYLESYAARFELPVRTGVRVRRLSLDGAGFVVETTDGKLEAAQVVVATGAYQDPKVPAFAKDLDPGIVQLHSVDYRNPSQLREGGVLVVGVGNSGADISLEVVRTHPTWLAGKESGHIPVRIDSRKGAIGFPVFRFMGHHVLKWSNPIGRKVLPRMKTMAAPLIRVKPKDLVKAGVQRIPRVAGVREGLPLLEDEQVLNVTNVIWCTGFRHDFSWIDLPVFDEHEEPKHYRGIVADQPGLYFTGLELQYSLSSDVITGVGRDAEYLAKHIASHRPADRVGQPARAIA
ncbi:MAG: flavin-containing monooxygenase [Actinomycetota bacterium]